MNRMLPTVFPVTCHTDHVGAGSTFVAIKGFKHDGGSFIPQALQKGASRIVVQEDAPLSSEILELIARAQAQIMYVPNTRRALAQLSAQAHGNCLAKLKIIGITGTKGKTTSSFLLEHILGSLGYKTALLSTVYNKINGHILPTQLTTQQPDYLHVFFDACLKAGVEYVVMETAAQALSMDRTYGLEFDGVLFTNFSLEHSEFYPTIDDYFAAKCQILDQAKKEAPVVLNADNEWCKKLSAQRDKYLTFALEDRQAHTYGTLAISDWTGITLDYRSGNLVQKIKCPALVGSFNAYNIVGVIALAHALGISVHDSAQATETFKGIPGRLECYALAHGARVFIDYAHNPSSFTAVLSTLRSLAPHLIVVFGAGGDRDKSKRPIMGSIATQLADIVILTTDNPRSEEPEAIIQDIITGVSAGAHHKVIIELDREQAIKLACRLATPHSAVALLGKGPDEYQLVKDIKTPFSEKAIIQRLV